MPGMNGLEATAAIRAREKPGGRVPIIAMTAHALKEDRNRCLEVGMDGYLSKPVNAREIISLVEGLARRRLAGDAGEAATATASKERPAEQPLGRPSVQAAESLEIPLDAPVFDPQEALSRCADSPELVRQMIECLLEEVDTVLPQIRAALANGDLVEVGRLGHRVKGIVVYLGARPAQEAALRVERLGNAENGDRLSHAEAAEDVGGFCRAITLLRDVLKTHAPPSEPMRGEGF